MSSNVLQKHTSKNISNQSVSLHYREVTHTSETFIGLMENLSNLTIYCGLIPMVLLVPEKPNDLCLRYFLHVKQVQWYFS